MTDRVADVLTRVDRGENVVAEIAEAVGLRPGRVYAILREHRPDRLRHRKRTSLIPDQVRALAAIKTKPARIAELLNVSRAYVYRIISVDNPQ